MEQEDDMIVVIIDGSDDEVQLDDEGAKIPKPKQIIKEEPIDEHDLMEIIETAKRFGEPLNVVDENLVIKIEYDSEGYDENQTNEYGEIEQHSAYENTNALEDTEVGRDDYDDEDYVPEGEEQTESEPEEPAPEKKRKRWTMLPPEEQKSFITDLKNEYPELRNDEKALISTLTEIMRSIKAPPLPKDYFIMNNISFECRKCGFLADRIQNAARHYQEKHGERYLVCFACGVDFRSTTNLYKHEKRCVAPDAIVMLKARARSLGRKGRSRPFLLKPEDPSSNKPHKQQIPKKFGCIMCSAIFNTKINLEAHINLHKGLRPYRCEECACAYTSYPRLKRHMLIHSDKEYICDHCGRPFKVKAALVTHLNTHLPVPKFGCAECPRRFATNHALQHHVRSVHRHLPPAHACPICGKSYPRMSLIKQHMSKLHGLSLMTRNMFFKQLPKLSDSELQRAQDIIECDDFNTGNPLSFIESVYPDSNMS